MPIISSGVLSEKELAAVERCMEKAARGRRVAAACLYGSRAAGYARPDSDIDLLLVLENYRYRVKYAYYTKEGGGVADISVLVVDRQALEKDAAGARLGEFVAGRLLHVYEPLINEEFLQQVETAFKRRVIIEELRHLVDMAGVLATEISFPLEYVLFSKVKRRAALYPAAAYSYYRTYANPDNLRAALEGYGRALDSIAGEDPGLLLAVGSSGDGGSSGRLLQISESRIETTRGAPSLRLARKRFHELSSYFVHSYAGRKMFHLAIAEAESKIRRRMQQVEMPPSIACPACEYLRLPEGLLVADSRRQDWLAMVAEKSSGGVSPAPRVTKRRLGNANSRTMLYVLENGAKLAVKDMSKSKSVKWAALSVWTAPVKKFRVDPLLRLGYEYRALRHLRRELGLSTPAVEAVVLDRRVLVTRFVEGPTLAAAIKEVAAEATGDGTSASSGHLRAAGEQIARVHQAGCAFGNIKPKNVIIAAEKQQGEGGRRQQQQLYFTDLDQFVFQGGDPAWDIAEFLSWGLKGVTRAQPAGNVVREFLSGYVGGDNKSSSKKVVGKLAGSRRYIETFYPVLVPAVAQAMKKEIRRKALL